jgi:hypothetical protein
MNVIKKAGITLFSMLLMGAIASALAATAPSTVVISGLDSPRGMDVDSKGNLYVALSGFGGSGPAFALTRSSLAGPLCQGNSGKVLKLTPKGVVTTVIDGLPSQAACQDFNGGFGLVPKGSVAFGPGGLQVTEDHGKVTLLMTFGGSTEEVNDFCLPGGATIIQGNHTTTFDTTACAPGFKPTDPTKLVQSLYQLWGSNAGIYNTVGRVVLGTAHPKYEVLYGQMIYIEDIFNLDSHNTAGPFHFPGPTNEENDVYALLKLDNQILAVDAGANAIWRLFGDGLFALPAVIMPNIGCSKAPCLAQNFDPSLLPLQESVPTTIAQNPVNGNIYVGELAGGIPGIGRIFLMNPNPLIATLTPVTITGDITATSENVAMAFDPKGNLYVVEYSKTGFAAPPFFGAPGALVKLHFTDALHATASMVDDTTLVGPSTVTVANGKIYVGNKQDTGLHQAEIRSYNIP